MYALNADGALKWDFETEDYIYSSPLIGSDGTVYFGGYDSYVYALNSDGTVQWRFKTGDKIESSPVMSADGTLYVGSNDGNLYALTTNSSGPDSGPWPMKGHDPHHTGNSSNILDTVTPVNIMTTTLPYAFENKEYAYTIQVEFTGMSFGYDPVYRMTEGPSWLSINDSGVLSGTPLQEHSGTNIPVSLIVSDTLGYADTLSVTISVIDVDYPPVFETVNLPDAMEGNAYSVTLKVTNPDSNETLVWKLFGDPVWLTLDSNGVLTGIPGSGDVGANKHIIIIVTDTGGLADTLSTRISVINVNNPPVILTTFLPDATEGTTYSKILKANDPDSNDILVWKLLETPSWLTVDSGGVLAGTPGNSDVDSNIRIILTVTDAGGLADTLSILFSVINVNNPPVILTNTLRAAKEETAYSDTVDVVDPDRDDKQFVFELLYGPDWLKLNESTGVFYGTPQIDDANSYALIILKVSDSGGLADSLVTVVRVLNVLDPPSNLIVEDVPSDNGHTLHLVWNVSPDDEKGLVSWYRIYRSRSDRLSVPIPVTQFASVDSLNSWDVFYTVLIDSVAAGVSEYSDENVPLNGETYFYWLQSAGDGAESEKIASGNAVAYVDNAPDSFQFSSPYPNPFNASATIEYSIPAESRVNLTILNISGQIVSVLKDEVQAAGNHSVIWNAAGMPSGMYICTLKARGSFAAKKISLLK